MTIEEKKKSVVDDYDDIAEEYCAEFFQDTSDNKYIDLFLASLSGKKVLDAGCGNGKDCLYVSQKGFDVNGIDFSEGMLNLAREKVPDGKFEVMDMTNISYPNNTYDGIISSCSLFHIPTEELPRTLLGFKRILKPNGKLLLILQEGNGEQMIDEPYREGVQVYMNYFSAEQIQELLKQYGFTTNSLHKEKSPNEFELGDGKLIVIATNEKIRELPRRKDDDWER